MLRRKHAGLKIVSPSGPARTNILALKAALDRGLIGDCWKFSAHGSRINALVARSDCTGVHLFDLMRFFAGDPSWCTAAGLARRPRNYLGDAHRPPENIGLVAGDEINAQFGFS